MILKTLFWQSYFFSCIGINRDGERIDLGNYAHCLETDCICKSASETWDVQTSRTSKVTLQLRRGFYHDRYNDIAKVSFFIDVAIDRHPYTHTHTHTQTCVRLYILHLSFSVQNLSPRCICCLILLLAPILDFYYVNRISLLIWWLLQMLALLLIQVGCQQLYAFWYS